MSEIKEKFDKTAYKNKFIAKNYDRINLTVDKGDKAKIAEHAKRHRESVNGFINRAIKETIERDENNFTQSGNPIDKPDHL